MAITTGQAYHFYFGTVAEFNAAKTAGKINDQDLYFLTDTKQIYVGENLYTGSVEFVTEFPNSPSQGVIYCNPTTHETKIWNGSAWQVMVPAVETEITASTTGTNLANVAAIRNYVAGEIGSSYTITKQGTPDSGYSATYQLFKGETAVGDKINIPKDLVVESGELKFCETKDVPVEGLEVGDPYIELVLANATAPDNKIYIPVADLVDTYTVDDTDSVDLTLTGTQITADVKVSNTTGNKVSIESGKGLYVAPDYIGSIDDTTTVDLDVDANAKLTAAVKVSATAGNTLTAGADGLYVATPFVTAKGNTATVNLTETSGTITADVNVSATANNVLTAAADGLYVAPATWSQISAS